MLYCSVGFLTGFLQEDRLAKYDKWIADWAAPCDIPDPGIWQYTNQGNIPGIAGRVDRDKAYQDYPAIIRRAGLNHLEETEPGPAPEPEPAPEPTDKGWKVETGPLKDPTKLLQVRLTWELWGYDPVVQETAAGDAQKVRVNGFDAETAKCMAAALQSFTGLQTNAYKIVD